MGKLQMILCFLAVSLFIGVCSPVFADSINFEKCAEAANHHCMIQLPTQTTSTIPSPNYYIDAHFPQNGSPEVTGILSKGNYTALQNDVAVMDVQYSSTSAPPTLNFCPVALLSLENQGKPEYLDKFYNTNSTPPLNLTHYIYPDYCYTETGKNPIDGSHIISVPEFPSFVVYIGLALSIMSGVILSRRFKL